MLRQFPVLGPALAAFHRRILQLSFHDSGSYWEGRYARGGKSGAGSYGAIARFKAQVLNELVRETGVQSVIEFGCGDGAQLELAEYPRYTGMDVAPTAVRWCMEHFASDSTKSFIHYTPNLFLNNGAITSDMAISLDVLLHLVEDDTLEQYLKQLSAAARTYIVLFTEDAKEATLVGHPPHVRYRDIACAVRSLTGWQLTRKIENPLKGPDTQADFFIFERIPLSQD